MIKEDLIRFEEKVIERFKNKEIYSPLHLSGSVDGKLEDFLIDLFKDIKKNDWVFSTYRSHYHALLKGISEDWLMDWILKNKSIHVMNKEHKFVTSALVGGVLSQAVGTAMAIKEKQRQIEKEIRKQVKEGVEEAGFELAKETEVEPQNLSHVYVFVGDMTASLGVFEDCYSFAFYNDLPITFIIEDNGLSTDTPTDKAWGNNIKMWFDERPGIKYIKYERKYSHYGIEEEGEERSFFLT